MQDHEHRSEEENDQSTVPSGTNYVKFAYISLGLYFVLWVPGFLVNTVYLAQALGEERKTGEAPEGKGCLIALLIAGLVVPALGMVVLIIMSLAQVGV